MKKQNLIFAALTLTFVCACGGDGGDDNDGGNLTQIDRMGFPAINTALIPSSQKDAFNQGDPGTDSQYCGTMQSSIDGLRAAVAGVPGFPPADGVIASSVLTTIVCPDTLTMDLSKPSGFPNGRRLEDDVIDFTLGAVLDRGSPLSGGPGVSDAISLDSTFSSSFPYLGTPNP